MKRPNFFIVGAPKCGTTALSEYLREHKNVFMCTPKEPHFFASDLPEIRAAETEEEYLRLFEEATTEHLAIGEASVWYLYSSEAIKNIKKFNPDSKIIVMLRNPVDLVYSMYSQHLYSMNENENDFKIAWDLSNERKKGLNKPKDCRNIKLIIYAEIAKLGHQVENLMNVFPPEQVKIIFSEDFFANTRSVYKDVLDFLNIPDDQKDDFPVINQNKHHKIGWIGRFTQRPPEKLVNILLSAKKLIGIERIGVLSALRKMNKKKQQRTPLSEKLKEQIIFEYSSDIEKLSLLTNRNLNHWLDM